MATDHNFKVKKGLDVLGGDVNLGDGFAYKIDGTTVVDSSRNLSNIGTISSGPISTSGVISGGFDVANFYSATTQANLNIGRSAAQRINMYVTDGTGFLRYYQDETDTTDHSFHFQIQSSSTGTNKFYFNKSLEITGGLTLTGNLTVNGTTTTLNTATLQVEDKNIVLNYGSGDTSGSADGAGITIQDAVNSSTNATILWNSAQDRFDISHTIISSGNIETLGFLQHYGYLYSRTDLRVLNAAANGWNTWATRSNGTFNLSVGTITSGAITVDGGSNQSVIKSSSDAPLIVESTDAYSGINFKDPSGNSSMYYRGTNDHLYLHSAKFSVAGSTIANGYQFQVNGSANLTGSLAIGGTQVIAATTRNLTNIGTITSSGKLHVTGGSAGSVLAEIGSATQTQYVDLMLKSNSGTGEIFKGGSAYTSWGGASALNIYNSNEKIAFHPSGQANVVQIDTTGLNIGASRTIRMNGTTVIDSSRNLANIGTISSGAITGTTVKETDGGDGFTEIGSSSFGYFNWGIEIANPNNGYRAIRFAGKKKYFVLEADVLGTNSANHTGMFWGNADGTAILGGSTTGYKTTHQNSTSFHIRAINSNSNQETYNPGFSPSDGAWHHQKIAATPDGYVRVWIDGDLKFEETGYIPSAEGYLGFINYAGTVRYANIRCRTINEDEAQHFSNHIGNASAPYAGDDRFIKIANNTAGKTGTLVTADNGNTWLNADGGKDLWLNWYSLNSPASKADLQVGNGAGGGAILTVDGTNNRVGINDTSPSATLDVNGTISSGAITATNGSLTISTGYNLQWGGSYGSGNPSVSATSNAITFYPTGNTDGEVIRIDADGIDMNGHNLTEVPLITNTSDISIKPAAGQDVLLFNAHNSESQLRLYNNRQDASNVPVSSIVSYNSTQVSKIQFYRGGGGSSGYINFQVKPQNGESLTDTFQIGDSNTVGYGVNVRAGGYRVGGTTVIDSSRNLTNIGTISSGNITANSITTSASSTFSGGLATNNSQLRVKISPWTGTTYGYGMKSGMTFGGLSNNYALTFQMNDSTGRGFWWGRNTHTDAQGAMALTNDGKLTVSHSLRLGYGISDTTTPGATHALDVSGSISSGAITSTGIVSGTAFVGGLYAGATGAPDARIWAVSADYPNYGIFYNEGNPDTIDFKWNNVVKAYINMENGLFDSDTGFSVGGSTVWHAGNDGSGSGLDADLLDGLDLHTGRNNEANKVVRTDVNGYIQAGWINTTSGNNGTTAISRIYASQDGYIRYYTPANFGSQISSHINYNSLQNKPTIPTSLPANGGNADTLDGQHASAFALYDHFRSLGTQAFTGTASTAGLISEMESDGAFDSYTSAFKTSWSYAGNFNMSDAGRFTETAGTAFLTWTDNSSDSARGNITVLAIAPNTGGSAGKMFVYNDQGSTYAPGWREIWTSTSDGAGSGLDADLLDGQHGSYYLAYGNLTGTPTIPTIPSNNVVEGGTSYSGEYPMVARTSANTIYSHNGIKFNGAQNKLTVAGSVVINGGTSWHSGNDGSGSGLDADNLDGVTWASYKATGHTMLNVQAGNGNALRFWNGSSDYQITMATSSSYGRQAYEPNSDYNMYFRMNGGTNRGFVFQSGTSNKVGIDSLGNIRADGVISSNNKQAMNCAHWSNSGTSTGAIKITLPGAPGSVHSMPIIKIYTYQYNSNAHVVYTISGHNWSTASNWYNNRVTAEGGPPLAVRLGRDGTNYCIIIGETNTSWSYGHVTVELKAHPSFYAANQNFTTGWTATQITSMPSTVTGQTVGKIWHSANDGSGSGLDADTVDGINSSSLLRSDADDAYDGTLTMNGMQFRSSNVNRNLKLQGTSGGTDCGISGFTSDGTHSYQLYGTNSGYYGFLDGNWAAWDIQKIKNGTFKVDEGSGLQRVWNAGNDGSGSGLDADLLDGLELNSSNTNNQVNRVMRTDGSGYANFGWINTVSGVASGTLTRIYCSQDGYIRYLSPSNLATSWLRENVYNNLSDSTGSGANLNTVFNNSRSGNIDCWSGSNFPSGTSHVQGIQVRHSTGSHYGFQLVNQYSQDKIWHRRITNNSFGDWQQVWTANSDGTGSGLDADLLDGQEGSYYLNAANFNGTAPTGSPFLSDFVHLGNANGTGYSTDDGSWGSRLNVSSNVHAKIEVSQQANSMRSHWFAHTGQDSIKFGTSTNHDVEFQRNGSTHLEIQSASVNATNGFTVGASNHTVWHAGNDGPSSGLDADTVDGYHRHAISRYQSASNFADGTLVTTNINSGNTNGDSFVIEISGKAYGSSRPHTVVAEGYIYNNTIINTNGSNIGGSNFTYLKVMNISGNLCFWWPRHGYWNSYDVFVRSSSAGTGNHNRVTAIANSADPTNATKKIQINLVTGWTSANDGSGSGLDADTVDGLNSSQFLRRDTSDTMAGRLTILGNANNWSEGTQGSTTNGSIHLDPETGADNHGNAITWGASDTGNGSSAQAGIYVRSDGSYGTKMYISTTDSYAAGSKTSIKIDHSGHVTLSRGNLYLGNRIYNGSGTAASPSYSFSLDGDSGMFSLGSNAVGFSTGGVQRFKINSNGLLLTGTSALYVNGQETISSGRSIANVVNYANTDGHMTLNRTGNAALIINRKGTTTSSKGELLNFKSQNAKVGRIGYAEPYGGVMYLTTGNTIGCGVGVYSISISGNTSGYFFPSTLAGGNFDNVMDLGASATRWDDVYATNGTIQTSDRNEKQDIQALTDAETAAATACKGLIRRFRWIDSVEEKGDDARYHFGAIAQDVESAFTAEGLDAGDYGLFIRSTWWEHEGHSYPSAAVAPTGAVEKTRLGIRYNQLFAFIISAL